MLWKVRLLAAFLLFTPFLLTGCQRLQEPEDENALRTQAWQAALLGLESENAELTEMRLFPHEQEAVRPLSKNVFRVQGYGFARRSDGSLARLTWNTTVQWGGREEKEAWQMQGYSLSSKSAPWISPEIALVPLDTPSEQQAREMQTYLWESLRVKARLLPTVRIAPESTHADRNQVSADALLRQMTAAYPGQAANGTLLIGITEEDLFTENEGLRFVFSSRKQDDTVRLAVLSTFRLDPRNTGKNDGPPMLQSRLHKQLLRNIGLLQYRMTTNQNPQSLFFSPVMSVHDLDAMDSL